MKLFGFVSLIIVSSAYGGCKNGNAHAPRQHYDNLIVGGGPAGLYTAWRLSSSPDHESTAIFEWSPKRLGGRVFTKRFPGGQFVDLGAWRFLPTHVLLQQVLRELNLGDLVTDFPITDNRLYYLRGIHINEKDIPTRGVPYNTIHRKEVFSSLFDEITNKIYRSNDTSRARWCDFWDEGLFPGNVTSNAYRRGDVVGNIGYWNLFTDQFGEEGFQYASDANGFTADVINAHSAYSIFYNAGFSGSSSYKRVNTGYWKLIDTLAEESVRRNVRINLGQRLTEFHWNANERKFYATFVSYGDDLEPSGRTVQITSDRLFLCMPRRSLELIRETDVVGEWPANKERRVLKHAPGEFYINSVIDQPAYKVGLIYDHPWWLDATYKPNFSNPSHAGQSTYNYGPTFTDLPLRQVYYLGNNAVESRGKPVYVLLATYSDMRYSYFWRELELSPQERLRPEDPAFLQPLNAGTPITSTLHRVLRQQLNEVHYGSSERFQVPPAIEGYFMNWGRDPFAAGYHHWKAHYNLAEAQYYMTRPSEAIGVEVPVHMAGETYAFDQSWIEGAFATAETVLVDKIGLHRLLKDPDYVLICRPRYAGRN